MLYEFRYDILNPHEPFYRVMKMIHQIGKKIHGLIHDMAATHEEDFVESFDVLWERVCRDIFYIIDYASKSKYACIKIHSYDAPPSSNDYHQRDSPHDLCLQHLDA